MVFTGVFIYQLKVLIIRGHGFSMIDSIISLIGILLFLTFIIRYKKQQKTL